MEECTVAGASSNAAGMAVSQAAADATGREPAPRRPHFFKRHRFLFWFLLLFTLLVVWNLIGLIWNHLNARGVFSGPRVGLIRIDGPILDAEPVARWAEQLRRDPTVHGVLVRIDSPGGAVVPSQEMHAAVSRLAAVKPVVVSMGTAAASGGYYVAVAGHYIVANPGTLTGSIGVRMDLMDMQKLFDVIGIRSQGLTSGPMKEAGTPFRPLREDERDYLQSMVRDMYEGFVQAVAVGRGMELAEVRALADGRAYTGQQALHLKLVDAMGDMDTAMQELTRRCNLAEPPGEILAGPPSKVSWLRELLSSALELKVGELTGATLVPYRFYY